MESSYGVHFGYGCQPGGGKGDGAERGAHHVTQQVSLVLANGLTGTLPCRTDLFGAAVRTTFAADSLPLLQLGRRRQAVSDLVGGADRIGVKQVVQLLLVSRPTPPFSSRPHPLPK